MEIRWARGYNRKSANHLEEVSKVRSAYSDFWKNIKFRKGWDAPLFTEEEVDHLLQDAAEITVCYLHSLFIFILFSFFSPF